ncbi:MAG: uracil phosphoribosyltransferase [Chitinophagaceae bacterium]|jgi:pyrimidine operon attenuation protein/uracil phosphoribosyltransferase|nr:uracil phosphoribosyltransferase [Chitinophagaceae bacterium]
MADKKYILDKPTAGQKLQRLALEVAEQFDRDEELIIIGVKTSGLVIAEKIGESLRQYIPGVKIISASLDKRSPKDITFSETIDFTAKNILITDDVSNSGKTLLYVLKPLLDFHPKRIQTLVLVERMHKQFPVKPDYVGSSIATTLQDHIYVEVENGEISGAYVQ